MSEPQYLIGEYLLKWFLFNSKTLFDPLSPFQHSEAQAILDAGPVQSFDLTVKPNSQDWAQHDGAIAFHLIERHADTWADIRLMMDEYVKAKCDVAQVQPDLITCNSTELDMSDEAMEKAFQSANPETYEYGEGYKHCWQYLREQMKGKV